MPSSCNVGEIITPKTVYKSAEVNAVTGLNQISHRKCQTENIPYYVVNESEQQDNQITMFFLTDNKCYDEQL